MAVPVRWGELNDVTPAGFELGRLPTADPLQELLAAPGNIIAAFTRIRALAAAADIAPEPFDRFRS